MKLIIDSQALRCFEYGAQASNGCAASKSMHSVPVNPGLDCFTFARRYLNEKPNSENSNSGGGAEAARWAVIQVRARVLCCLKAAEESHCGVLRKPLVLRAADAVKNPCVVGCCKQTAGY
eukprot:1156978-Pelagomonas_calceolata.AAC.11